MSKIVKMPRNEAINLVRMGRGYLGLNAKRDGSERISTPTQVGNFYEKFGGGYVVSDIDSVTEAFSEDFDITVLAPKKVPNDANKTKAEANQTHCSIAKESDGVYKISADFSKLQAYVSTDVRQARKGEQYWLALCFATGLDSIVGVEFCGQTLGVGDVTEATAFGISAGGFLLFDNIYPNTTKRLLLTNGTKNTIITLVVEDVAEEE